MMGLLVPDELAPLPGLVDGIFWPACGRPAG